MDEESCGLQGQKDKTNKKDFCTDVLEKLMCRVLFFSSNLWLYLGLNRCIQNNRALACLITHLSITGKEDE